MWINYITLYHLIFVVKIKINMRVCILGTGLSSLTLAKALVNLKINVDILIEKKRDPVNKSRTIGISKSNVDFLNKKVINIEKIIWKLNKIEIYSEKMERQKIINFIDKNNYLFSIVKNSKLQEILAKSLKKNKYFKISYLNKKKKLFRGL